MLFRSRVANGEFPGIVAAELGAIANNPVVQMAMTKPQQYDLLLKDFGAASDNSKSIQRGEKTKRYLPSRVWDKLTPAEKAAANRTKAQGAKKGKQFVPNPPSVTKKFSYNSKTEFFDPSQPRDESGKWTKAGGVISDMLKKGWDKVGGPFYEKKFPEGKVTADNRRLYKKAYPSWL